MTLFEVKPPPTIGDQQVTGPQGFISSGDFWIVAVVGLMSGVVER